MYTHYLGLEQTNLPPEVPKSECCGSSHKVTSTFIRNKGLPTYFDNPLPNSVVNNPPPIPVYVRLQNGRFYINGKDSPRLVLQRNGKYQFNIVSECCPFYFSSKPGGASDIFGIPPTTYDLRTYVVNDTVPNKFYYTSVSGKSGELVGEVIVV